MMLFPGLQFSNHGRHAMARAVLPGWSWPTLADGMRRVLRTTVVVLGLGGAMASCAPPPLTSTSTTPTINQSYFYGIFAWSEERDREGYESSIQRIIEANGDNYSNKIMQRVNDSRGSCLKNGASIACAYSDSRQSRDCFKDRCSIVSRSWTVRIRWVDRPGPVDPVVSVQLKVTRQPA
jgi:hypothetical protein